MKQQTMNQIAGSQYQLHEVCIRLEKGRTLYSDRPMSNPEAALDVMREELSGYDREVLCVVNLNSRLQPLCINIVSVGDINQTIAGIPNIYKSGILTNASSVMLLHNHPSGDVTPSSLDIMLTQRVIEAGKIIGIPCTDHIIVGGSNGDYISLRDQGLLKFEGDDIQMTAEEIMKVGEMNMENNKMNIDRQAQSQKEKIKALTQKLEDGVKDVYNSENYKDWLNVCSKLHNYSVNNQLLIAMQRPDASMVAGYTTWKSMDRYVQHGEKGIQILCPAPKKVTSVDTVKNPVTGEPEEKVVERTLPRFKVGYVWDVSQTEGKPLPELAAKLDGTVDGYDRMIDALQDVSPVPVRFEAINGSANGYYDMAAKQIVVKKGMSEQQTVKTLIHEITHADIHDKDKNPASAKMTASGREIEAESVAYVVCQHYGIDSSQYSFGYVGGWADGKDLKQLHSSMETIRQTSNRLIDKIDERFKSLENRHEAIMDLTSSLLARLDEKTKSIKPVVTGKHR